MNLFIIAGYFVVSIVIYAALTKVANNYGCLNSNTEKALVALALIWPLWGELAILAIASYLLLKVLQAVNTQEPTKQMSRDQSCPPPRTFY